MELTPDNSAVWLEGEGFAVAGGHFVELGGGVSNKVILAELPGGRVILKQALGRLRVEREWLSDRERIYREASAMRYMGTRALVKAKGGRVPRLLAENRTNFVIAMEAAPAGAEMWKEQLFRGEFEEAAARGAGALLGSVVAASAGDAEAEALFGDQTVFDQLRIDPYYRFTAARHPEIAGYFEALMARSAARRVSVVHGDFSPKNLLVKGAAIWAIDWEVVHYGDPSYDVAFLLNHLLLKSLAMPLHRAALHRMAGVFMRGLEAELPSGFAWLESAALEHLPALLLARVEGKSPAEYLDAGARATAWRVGLDLIERPARTVGEAFTR